MCARSVKRRRFRTKTLARVSHLVGAFLSAYLGPGMAVAAQDRPTESVDRLADCARQPMSDSRRPTSGLVRPFDTAAMGCAEQDPQGSSPEVGQHEYPSLHFSAFGDFNYAATSRRRPEDARGFSEGQFAIHLASELSPRVNFFGELTLTARPDGGTGSPAAPGFNPEVERAIIRFDESDRLKVSFGRYHTPINWWNTAFHHGQWLQTTIGRPEMVQFGGRFLPIHFVGALVEGAVPASGWHVNYQAGLGNGRGSVISRAGDPGDSNGKRAWLMNVFTKPDRPFGLQLGGSAYFDTVTVAGGREFGEQIVAAHAVWQKEDPEVIAEIAGVRHEESGQAVSTWSHAFYIQTAYRLPVLDRLWKPYYRFEKIAVSRSDPVFLTVSMLDESIVGVRYDASTYVAIKGEYRVLRRIVGSPLTRGGFVQVSFTF